jgi:beta-N-acetylhexosaminidase
VFESIDPDAPATMSDKVISGLLRDRIGFQDAVFSDDLEMQAITAHGSVEEAGVRAIAAGCDLLLVCSDVDAARRVRRALVDEASRNEAFHHRLAEAAGRASALRRRAASLPGPQPLEQTLADPELDAIRKQLRALC